MLCAKNDGFVTGNINCLDKKFHVSGYIKIKIIDSFPVKIDFLRQKINELCDNFSFYCNEW